MAWGSLMFVSMSGLDPTRTFFFFTVGGAVTDEIEWHSHVSQLNTLIFSEMCMMGSLTQRARHFLAS